MKPHTYTQKRRIRRKSTKLNAIFQYWLWHAHNKYQNEIMTMSNTCLIYYMTDFVHKSFFQDKIVYVNKILNAV